jgi:hypothetical protein
MFRHTPNQVFMLSFLYVPDIPIIHPSNPDIAGKHTGNAHSLSCVGQRGAFHDMTNRIIYCHYGPILSAQSCMRISHSHIAQMPIYLSCHIIYYVPILCVYIINISHDICLGEAATADRPDLFVGAGPAERSLAIAMGRYVVTMWMVAKSCITKRMVETLTKYIMGCLPSIYWCRISQPSTVVSKIIQSLPRYS